MKLGKSIHFIGEPGLSWAELGALVRGLWPEMHISRARHEGVALLEPSTRVALLTADLALQARGSAKSAHEIIYPDTAAAAADPGKRPARTRPRTAADLQEIRDRVERMRAVAVPA